MKKNKLELLAPAGDMEKLKTAVHFGADAVYFAGKNYGLRAYGTNFENFSIKEAMDYLHEHGKKGYVTLNVYARHNDFDGLKEYLLTLVDAKVDAVIVSDLGIFTFIKENFPNLNIHVSTQANVTNSYAVKMWKNLGAERIVLARELDIDEIKRAADFCHLHDVKLHLAVNTIMLDEELNNFEEYIKSAANAGIDACIVQDVGVANIIRSVIPDMPLHASTQMTVHTLEGALWAKEQGFCRVVVSRELSREEIKCIIIGSGMEVEQFVHGALCMSVSGQCYLSALIGSRSANRGRCAQACRLPFSACGKDDVCSLSLKDLSLVEHMNELIEDGVTSLKIEGRMKRPEYVAAAVTALKMAIAGEEPDMETLKAVFSRSGFTDGYYTGKRHNMFGTREKEDVISASVVIPKLRELYRKESHPIGLSITAKLCADEPFTLIGKSDDGICVAVYGDVPLPAFKKPSDYESLKKQLSKLGPK